MSTNPRYLWALVVACSVAVIALIVSAQLAFWVGFFAVLGWWAWLAPRQAIYLFIVLAPILPMLKITQTIGTFTLVKDIIILVLFTKLFLAPLIMKKLPYRRNILVGPILALLAWSAVAAVRSEVPLLGLLRARDIVLYVLLYLAVLYLPRDKRFYKDALVWFLLSAAIVGGLGWYQFFVLPDSAVLRFDPAREIWIPRVSSVMAHPSIFGQYLILASLGLAALFVTSQRGRWRWAGLWLLFAPLVYYTFARAVWLGYAAGLGIMAIALLWDFSPGRKKISVVWRGGLLLLGILIVLAGANLTNVGVFVRSGLDPTYGSNAERIEFLARLISPVTATEAMMGAGLGDVLVQNFREVNISTFDIASGASRAVQLTKNRTLVDNQWLKTFVEMGFVGILIYLWLYWRMVRHSWLLATSYQLPATRMLGLWGLGFTAAFVSQAFFIDIWDIFPTNAAFWIMAALVSREQIRAQNPRRNLRYVSTVKRSQ